MKLKIFFSVMAIFLLTAVVLAHEENSNFTGYENIDAFLADLPHVNEELQENEVLIPESADFLIKEGNIAMKISTLDNSSKNFYVAVKNKRIISINKGLPEKSSYDFLSDEETINNILKSEDYANGFLNAYKEKKIKIEANGFTNNIKLFFAKIFFKIFG